METKVLLIFWTSGTMADTEGAETKISERVKELGDGWYADTAQTCFLPANVGSYLGVSVITTVVAKKLS